jgi:transporter family protein
VIIVTSILPWQAWAFGAAAFAALTAIFGKIGVTGINSDFATFIRTVIIVGVLLVILLISRQMQPLSVVQPKTWLFLTLSALATGGSWLCYYRALQIGQASQVAPIDKLSVVLVAIFGSVFLGEHLGWKNWLGVALVATGAILAASQS